MEKIKEIVKNLLNEMDELEVQYHQTASKKFFSVNAYVVEFGSLCDDYYYENKDKLDVTDIKHHIALDVGCYDSELETYFFDVEDILWTNLTAREKLEKLNKLVLPHLSVFHYDTKFFKIKNNLSEQIVSINELLDNPDTRVLRIKEAQAKVYITVEDFEILFSYSKESQKKFRNKPQSQYPLPIFSGKGNKVLYDKVEVLKWFERRDKYK